MLTQTDLCFPLNLTKEAEVFLYNSSLIRLCVRRQSSRFKSEEPAPSEDLFELDDITLPMHSQVDEKKGGDGSASLALSDNGQDAVVRNSTGSVSTEERRTSIARPSRRAAEKVQSYKEIPLNVKMRRST